MSWCRRFIAALPLLALGAVARPASAQVGDPLGEHEVVVLVGKYPETSDPKIDATAWAGALQKHVNTYFAAASGYRTGNAPSTPHNQTTWHFTAPHPAAIDLVTKYDAPPPGPGLDEANDPRVFQREMREALETLDGDHPEVLADPARRRVILIVNRPKRGRTLPFMPYRTKRRGLVNVEAVVINEPFADGTLDDSKVVGDDIIAVDGGINFLDLDPVSLVAHELGHTLLLPDLYRETAISPGPEYTEFWCQMGTDNLQSFSGFTRQTIGFVDDASGRIEVVTPPAAGEDKTFPPITIFPPGTAHGANEREVVLIPRPTDDFASISPTLAGAMRRFARGQDPGAGFTGFILEARDRAVGADAPWAMPVPGTTDVRGAHGMADVGLHDEYVAGLLVSYAKPWILGSSFPPANPLEVQPREYHGEQSDIKGLKELRDAAYAAGQTATLDAASDLTVSVLAANADGSVTVQIHWHPPAFPDVTAVDAFLDNPLNGWDTFTTDLLAPGRQLGEAPPGAGDDILFWQRIELVPSGPGTSVPMPKQVSVDHRVHVRVRNQGTAAVKTLEADLFVTDPVLFGAVIDWPVVISNNAGLPYSPLGAWKIGPRIGDEDPITHLSAAGEFHIVRPDGTDGGRVEATNPLEPGAVADAWIRYEPGGPFATWLLVRPAVSVDDMKETLEQLWNNVRPEPFVTFITVPGSPYQPVDLKLPVQNVDQVPRTLVASVQGIPEPTSDLPDNGDRDPRFWTADFSVMSSTFMPAEPMFLTPKETTTFQLHVQPPDPELAAPGDAKNRPHPKLVGWMSYDDSFVPIGEMPFEIRMSFRTAVATALVPKTLKIAGTLEWLAAQHPDGVEPAHQRVPAGLPVAISLTPAATDGTAMTPILITPTDARHTAWTKADGTFEQDLAPFLPSGVTSFAVVAQFPGSDAYAASVSRPLLVIGGVEQQDTGCDPSCAVGSGGSSRAAGLLVGLLVALALRRRARRMPC